MFRDGGCFTAHDSKTMEHDRTWSTRCATRDIIGAATVQYSESYLLTGGTRAPPATGSHCCTAFLLNMSVGKAVNARQPTVLTRELDEFGPIFYLRHSFQCTLVETTSSSVMS